MLPVDSGRRHLRSKPAFVKHQYFGDLNDYRKYGLLRALRDAGLSVGINWMLTPNDGRNDGTKLSYLDLPGVWRRYDPELFDVLKAAVAQDERHTRSLENSRLLEGAQYFGEFVPDRGVGREAHAERGRDALGAVDLVFFDPDNGIEVKSVPFRARASNKFVYWSELLATWECGLSLLVYQHYPRIARQQFEDRLRGELRARTGGTPLLIRTGHVLFILLPQVRHASEINAAIEALRLRWVGQLDVARGGTC